MLNDSEVIYIFDVVNSMFLMKAAKRLTGKVANNKSPIKYLVQNRVNMFTVISCHCKDATRLIQHFVNINTKQRIKKICF